VATYWCAANFAFMMAEDIKQRVGELPWVERVEVRLQGHFFAEEINDAIARGLSFAEAFPHLGAGDLAELRDTFRRKAFLARQERLIGLLLERVLTALADDLDAPTAVAAVQEWVEATLGTTGLAETSDREAAATIHRLLDAALGLSL